MRDEHIKECRESLMKLIGRKIIDIKLKSRDRGCWRFYVDTDDGEFILTFCKEWDCPAVEHWEEHGHDED